MRRLRVSIFVVILVTSITGCASLRPVGMDPGFWQEKGKRIGVLFLALPPAQVEVNATPLATGRYGSPFILGGMWNDHDYFEAPLLREETRPLQHAFRELNAQEFVRVQDLFTQSLQEKGLTSFKVEQHIDEGSLPRFKGQRGDGVYECKDYRDLGKEVHADYLIVIGLRDYGTICRYVGMDNYDVEVYAETRAFMVEAATNKVMWGLGSNQGYFSRTVNARCARPDHIPIILDELNTLLKEAATYTAGQFFSPEP